MFEVLAKLVAISEDGADWVRNATAIKGTPELSDNDIHSPWIYGRARPYDPHDLLTGQDLARIRDEQSKHVERLRRKTQIAPQPTNPPPLPIEYNSAYFHYGIGARRCLREGSDSGRVCPIYCAGLMGCKERQASSYSSAWTPLRSSPKA